MSTSFRDAYGTLQQHAETLRRQEEPNIDDLLTIVTESVSAYKICKQRIDAVEEALKAALDGVAVEPAAVPAGNTRRSAPEPQASQPAVDLPWKETDDDVPF